MAPLHPKTHEPVNFKTLLNQLKRVNLMLICINGKNLDWTQIIDSKIVAIKTQRIQSECFHFDWPAAGLIQQD